MDSRGFQKPKVYDPAMGAKALAERPLERPLPTMAPTPLSVSSSLTTPSRHQQMRDLGFDEEQSPQHVAAAAAVGGVQDERCRELTEQLGQARQRVVELEASAEELKTNDSRTTMKLQSFQQVNRSQTTLMKGELQKTRRRLAHMQAVATRLREQAEFFQQQAPSSLMPDHLHGLPSEDDACAQGEGEELANLQNRWENDIVQLQVLLLKENGLEGLRRSPSPPVSEPAAAEVGSAGGGEEVQKRIKDLETAVRKLRKQNIELQASGGAAAAGAVVAGGASEEELTNLRKELESSEEKSKDQQKKLKQLATAYKKIEQEKNEAAGKLKEALETKGKAVTFSPTLLTGVRSALADSKAQVLALRSQVQADLLQQLPVLLEQAMQSKLPELQRAIEDGSREWREKYTVECEKRRKLHNLVQELKGNIRVYVRVRPLAAHESGSCVNFPSPDEIRIQNEETGTKKTWQFNMVLNEKSTQTMLFDGIRDLVSSMLDGYNVCIFAYGQTGAGKTHSMQGTKEQPGIYTRTFNELFKVAQERKGWKIELKGALIEVYNEEIRDLLGDKSSSAKKQKLEIKQGKDGNHVPGLTIRTLTCPAEVEDMLTTGSESRSVACTDMNSHSSRSHLLVQIFGSIITPEGKVCSSTITLVDLAGSERLAKSGVTGDRAKEAIAINKSLAALGDVINSRASKSSHTPFRNSTLTHLLQDSLSGDSKTLMLLAMNPCKDHVEESMCSLQFGARVNNVEMSKK
mmetsp:Transcript_91538/g.296319  ORF Transcript_91538/g.296319 Transcript_91538/m.296319 type:complete len:746 (+) Transcript_91538:103-2340(+)